MSYIDNYGNLVTYEENYCLQLYHHGVLGQKWGRRNGPPYPLSAGAHSASEKKAGWRKSIGASSGQNSRLYGTSSAAKAKSSAKPKTESKDKEKEKKDSNTISAAAWAAKIAIDVARLNVIGLAYDSKRMIDYGRARTKMAMEKKRVADLKVDKKTGFHLKEGDSTPEEDMKHVNPGYMNFDTNTKNNCMLCTTAYELRRRGYDVQAGTSTTGYSTNEVTKWFPKSKIENVYSSSADKKSRAKETFLIELGVGSSGKEKYKKLSESMLKHGDGARGNLMLEWDSGSGHSVVWENQNGNIILRDCQSNKTYSKQKQIERILGTTVGANYVRTDNVDFDLKKIKEHIR